MIWFHASNFVVVRYYALAVNVVKQAFITCTLLEVERRLCTASRSLHQMIVFCASELVITLGLLGLLIELEGQAIVAPQKLRAVDELLREFHSVCQKNSKHAS